MNSEEAKKIEALYWDKELTIPEVADELGCSTGTVYNRMERYEIPRRKRGQARNGEVSFRYYTAPHGYEYLKHYFRHKDNSVIPHHRLLATLLVDDLSELEGKQIHHKNGIEWDNRLDNLEVLSVSEHIKAHR